MANNIDTIASELVEGLPEPQEHAIEAEEKKHEVSADTSGLLDRGGRPFDPAYHVADADGKPVLNRDGTVRQKRGRGAPSSRLGTPKAAAAPGAPGSAPATVPADAGRQIAEMIFAFGQLIGGEEFAPQINEKYGQDERAQMQDAWSRYCEEKGISDVPPGMAVIIATVGYIAPRLFMPKTKSRLEKLKNWIGAKYYHLRGAKEEKDRAKSAKG